MNYSWLKDRQKQARAEKQAAQRPLYRPSIQETFSMYTGAGEDGVVQPTMPTHMIQTNRGPRTLDEGEILKTGPGGQFQVIPASQVGGQGKMLDIAGRVGAGRYFTGFNNVAPPIKTDQFGQLTLPPKKTIEAPEPTTGGVSNDGLSLNLAPGSNTLQIQDQGAANVATANKGLGNFVSGALNTAATNISNQQQIPNTAVASTPEASPAGSAGVSLGNVVGNALNKAVSNYKSQQVPTTPVAPAGSVATTSTETNPANTAMTALRRQALYGSDATRLAGQKASEDIAGRQAVERAVLNQKTAMGNAPEGSIAAQQARLRAEQSGELNAAETQYGIAGAQAMEAAQRALPGEERTQQAFDFTMLKDKSQQAYDEFLRAAETGDDATVAAAYEKYYGRPITGGAMVNDIRNYARGTKAQALESGDLAIQAQRAGLTEQQFNQANSLIGAGYDADQVFAATGIRLNPTQFEAVRAYSPAGQTDFTRTQTAFNTLMASNDPKNIAQAATLFGKMFPGVSFDATSLIEQVGQEKFAKGMEQMATLSSTFKTWDEAKTSAEGLGLIKTFGEQAAKEMFSGLKVNAIDEQWNTWEESTFYQGLPPEEQKNIADIFTASMTGELSFDIQPEFTVTDANGKVVGKYATQELADAAKKDGQTVTPTKKYVMKSMTGAQTVVNVGPNGEPVTEKIDPAKPLSDEAWGKLSLKSQWDDHFLASVPSSEKERDSYDETDLYDRWIKAGKPQTWDALQPSEGESGSSDVIVARVGNNIVENGVPIVNSNELKQLGVSAIGRDASVETIRVPDSKLIKDSDIADVAGLTEYNANNRGNFVRLNPTYATNENYTQLEREFSNDALVRVAGKNVGKIIVVPAIDSSKDEAWLVLGPMTMQNTETGQIVQLHPEKSPVERLGSN